MNVNEVNFTFDGLHCYRDFGCWFLWDQIPMCPKATRDSYTVSGRSGTVLLSGRPVYDEMPYKGTLCFRDPPGSEQEARRRWRSVCRWLRGGRHKLVLDCEPDRFYLAQVDAEITWSNGGWDEGELAVEFVLQPYSYAGDQSTAQGTYSEAGTLALTVPSDEAVPIGMRIINDGAATLTGISIVLGEASLSLAGMPCAPGDVLEIAMDAPIGATLTHTDGDTETVSDALPYATAFPPLLGYGGLSLAVSPTFDGDGGSVTVLAYARGVAV